MSSMRGNNLPNNKKPEWSEIVKNLDLSRVIDMVSEMQTFGVTKTDHGPEAMGLSVYLTVTGQEFCLSNQDGVWTYRTEVRK